MTPTESRIYTVLTRVTAPVWVAMLVAPRSRATAVVVRAATPLTVGLGAVYAGLVGASVVGGGPKVSFNDGESVRAGLSTPRGFLTAWAHMVTLDLVTGRVLWERGLREGRDTRAALLATWFAGPTGLVVDAALSARRGRSRTGGLTGRATP